MNDVTTAAAEFDADPAKLREVVQCADTFDRSVTVYTWDGGEIIKEQCEEPGWPNVTHAGHIMYDNTYSTDKRKVVAWAKEDARLAVEYMKERIEDDRKKLAEFEERLARHEDDLAKLIREYPAGKKAKKA